MSLVRKLFLLLFLLVVPLSTIPIKAEGVSTHNQLFAQQQDDTATHAPGQEAGHQTAGHHGSSPAPWSVLPFVVLLLMIATGPLFYPHIWHKYYPYIAAALGSLVVFYYLAYLHDHHHPIHSLFEYLSFIALLTALFVASGGILIKVDREGTPIANVILLVFGSAIANVIGTTGASMLLIRPFIRLNQHRIRAYHVVFFIFMVSNVGGCLTPIGDPPLFLGFLKGVPFFWTVVHLFPKWFFGVGLLALIFYFIDRKNHADNLHLDEDKGSYTGRITVKGLKNVVWLAITIGAVFLDPNVVEWVPAITIDGTEFSFLREAIMFTTAFLAYKFSDEECLKGNEFDFEPIKEVAFLFIGIFATMMPALQLISEFAGSEAGRAMVNTHTLYWATGMLSGVLDNAPTYLNFLAAGMGKAGGLDISNKADVLTFAHNHAKDLIAVSVGAVFFGAMTYIGNAPNFMVKSIAEQIGIEMPSFMGYVIRYSIPFLVPVLLLTWLVFFVLI